MPIELSIDAVPGKAGGCAGRVGATLFFAIFLAMGAVFTGALAKGTWSEIQSRRWPSVPCTIVSSEIIELKEEIAFNLSITFRYDAPDRPRASPARTRTHNTLSYNEQSGSDDYREVRALADRYRPGTVTTCYVDPANPDNAILEHGPLWIGLLIPLPLMFVAVGVIGIGSMWRKGRSDVPISNGAVPPGKNVGLVVSLVFLALGVGFLAIFFKPVSRMVGSISWTPTPATVLRSHVKSSSGSHGGSTYAVAVFYEYVVNGRTYRSSRYEFLGGTSSSYYSKQEAVDQMPAGASITCYVNPTDPTDAVISRSPSWPILFGIIPLLFVLIGGGGVIGSAVNRRKEKQAEGGSGSIHSRPDVGPTMLKPVQSRRAALIGAWFGFLFLSTVYSAFAYAAISSWRRGNGEVCLSIILIPLTYIGFRQVVKAIRESLRFNTPRVTLRIDPPVLSLGGPGTLYWSVTRPEEVRSFKIRMLGYEETTIGTGKSSRVEFRAFFEADVIAVVHPAAEINSGSAKLQVPPDAVQSWTGTKNKIVWMLSVTGDVPGRPAIDDAFILPVGPAIAPVEVTSDFELDNPLPRQHEASSADGSLSISIPNRGTICKPGETIQGIARWNTALPKGPEVRLIWYSDGKGNRDVSIVSAQKIESAMTTAGAAEFALSIPSDAPPSFIGKLVSLPWAIELVAPRKNRAARIELIVSPTGKPIEVTARRAVSDEGK